MASKRTVFIAVSTSFSPIGDQSLRPPSVWPAVNRSETTEAIRSTSVAFIGSPPKAATVGTENPGLGVRGAGTASARPTRPTPPSHAGTTHGDPRFDNGSRPVVTTEWYAPTLGRQAHARRLGPRQPPEA